MLDERLIVSIIFFLRLRYLTILFYFISFDYSLLSFQIFKRNLATFEILGFRQGFIFFHRVDRVDTSDTDLNRYCLLSEDEF